MTDEPTSLLSWECLFHNSYAVFFLKVNPFVVLARILWLIPWRTHHGNFDQIRCDVDERPKEIQSTSRRGQIKKNQFTGGAIHLRPFVFSVIERRDAVWCGRRLDGMKIQTKSTDRIGKNTVPGNKSTKAYQLILGEVLCPPHQPSFLYLEKRRHFLYEK